MNIELLIHDINKVGERGGDCDEEGFVGRKAETPFLCNALRVFIGKAMVPRWSSLEESAPNNNRWLNRGLN
ncbi:hypothetical protein CXB51_024350 [Gossypium anomalum]|uniref:Uncharacterized protein n=1 Tax=Gossypium anomalum TaxID=47600 RepID=A0A8J6CS36_9ROSI|nr:hypothetical protein CXB51_024350 [Gossypium anomalum]